MQRVSKGVPQISITTNRRERANKKSKRINFPKSMEVIEEEEDIIGKEEKEEEKEERIKEFIKLEIGKWFQ